MNFKGMKRVFSLALIIALLIGSLAACSGSDSGSGETPAPDSNTERVAKDTLVVARNEDIASLDPSLAMNQRSFTVFSQIYEGLIKWNPETETVEPNLAKSWEQLDDVTWRFELRDDVTFHDGNHMTSEDVKFSFDRLQLTLTSSYVDYIEEITPDGDYGVIFKLKMPYSSFINALQYPCAVVVSKAAVEKYGDSYADHPVGTGPYMFVSKMAADNITLKRFDEYWNEPAKTENLIFKIIPEGSQRTIMLENGEVDIACDILTNDAVRVEEDPNLNLVAKSGNKYYALYLSASSASATSNKLVRQAIAYAIDKDLLVSAVMNGYGTPGSELCTPTVAGYNPAKERGNIYDPEKAKALLAEAGYENGVTIDAYIRSGQPYEELATVIQGMLKDVGITINMNIMDNNKITQLQEEGEDLPIDIGFYNNICGDMDFIMQKLLPTTHNQTYFNDYVLELITAARSYTELSDRQKVYDKFHDLMAEDVPHCPLFYEVMLIGLNKNVEGFHVNPLGAHQYSTVVVYEN